MDPIRLDAETLRRLMASMNTVDICDESGKVVGRFTPTIDLTDYDVVGPDITDEELRRRIESKGPRYTTAEVIEYLKQL
jgi:hypothetical protein